MGNETVRVARNTFFASVGFGVLAFQKVQVRRRELEKTFGPQVEAWQRQIRSVIGHTPDSSADSSADRPPEHAADHRAGD